METEHAVIDFIKSWWFAGLAGGLVFLAATVGIFAHNFGGSWVSDDWVAANCDEQPAERSCRNEAYRLADRQLRGVGLEGTERDRANHVLVLAILASGTPDSELMPNLQTLAGRAVASTGAEPDCVRTTTLAFFKIQDRIDGYSDVASEVLTVGLTPERTPLTMEKTVEAYQLWADAQKDLAVGVADYGNAETLVTKLEACPS
ncbi:hypothetical protein ACX80N_12375 [Arthrobacter sp. MDT2-16]